MSRATLQVTRSQVLRWLALQGAIVTLVTLGFLFAQGTHLAESVLLGGLLWLIPSWVFAWVWLGYFKASAASKLVTLFYIAEVIKLVLIGLLFVFMLKYLHISIIGCLIGMICAQIAAWLAPAMTKNNVNDR